MSTCERQGPRAQEPVNGSPHPAVVLASGERKIVFVVDELVGTQTLVLKSLPAPLVRLRNISGAALLGTGEVVGVLNAADLFGATIPRARGRPRSAATSPAARADPTRR